eukprot:COSAG04_NODE_1664_length_6014_cov_7.936422_13_plen_27_part_01
MATRWFWSLKETISKLNSVLKFHLESE